MRVSFIVTTLAASLLVGCATRPSGPVAVKVLAINDFHGNLLPASSGIRIKDPGLLVVAQAIEQDHLGEGRWR